jgi:hypothetical protein
MRKVLTEHDEDTDEMVSGQQRAVVVEAGMAADLTGLPRPPSHPWRSRLRFSVRGLLLLILVIGCALGWIARVVRTGRVQGRAVAAIYQAGGWVLYDWELEDGQSTSTWNPRWPKWLMDRLGFEYFGNVVFVNLHDRGTDAVLVQVARLTRLKQLHRPGFSVTDAGVAQLEALMSLRLLSLDHTQVTDAGLAHLKRLRALKWLRLTNTKVTDAGIAELQKSLPALKIIR